MTPLRHGAVDRRLRDWNVVVTVQTGQFARACALLERFGTVRRTRFYNVLVMRVDDGADLLEALRTLAAADSQAVAPLMRVVPLTHTFDFSSMEEFERRAGEAALDFAHELAGRSFLRRSGCNRRRGNRGAPRRRVAVDAARSRPLSVAARRLASAGGRHVGRG